MNDVRHGKKYSALRRTQNALCKHEKILRFAQT